MANVADIVSGCAQSPKEFDGGHNRDEGAHRNHDGQWEKPNFPVREKNGVGDQDSENCTGSSDGGHVRGLVTPEERNKFHCDLDEPSSDATQKEIVEKALF